MKIKNSNLTLALGLASLLVLPFASSAQTWIYQGHTDIGIDYDETANEWNMHVHDDAHDIEYSPATNALLIVKPEAHGYIPSGAQWSFLGTAGAEVWTLPNVEDPNLLFLGFGAEEIDSGIFVNDELTVALKGITGPGSLVIYDLDTFGNPVVWMNTRDGIDGTDVRTVPPGLHQDLNFAFSAPGDYTVTFEASGNSVSNGPTSSGLADYNFHVAATNEVLINPQPPQIQVVASGNMLSLAWPTNRGWMLQSNSVSLTATNAWFPYPSDGSMGVTNVVVEIDATKPSVFFRLTNP